MESRQDGFSLIELLVAMLVTMIISGAVFALMSAGQGAFRREPALTDRQQNIRVAMDLVLRDIGTGGAGMSPFEQAFTRGDGVGNTAPFLNAAGPNLPSPTGQRSDKLEILGTIDCPAVPIEDVDGVNLRTSIGFPACYTDPAMFALTFQNGATEWGWGHNLHSGDNRDVNFPNGQQPDRSELLNSPENLDTAISVIPIQLVRYEIAPEADGVPGLWRSAHGGIDEDGDYRPATDAAANPTAGWQLVARGIEDFQVRYRPFNGAFADTPALVAAPNFGSITQEAEVTIWARAIGPLLQGQTIPAGASANLPVAVRGSLASVVAPRAALLALNGNGWR